MKRFAIPNKSHKAQMRFYGIVCLVPGVVFLFLYYANAYARDHGGHDISYALGYGIVLSALGALLLFLRIWAELVFAFGLAILALGLVYAIIADLPRSPEVLYNIPFIVLFLIPVLLSLRRLRSGAYFQRGT